MSALHRATCDGSVERTVALLSNGVIDISQRASDGVTRGMTPLMLSAAAGNARVVSILFNRGANVALASADGFTALHLAVLSGHMDTITLLLKTGADLGATAAEGQTPLHLAAHAGHTQVMTALMMAGADLQAAASSDRVHPASPRGARTALRRIDIAGEGRGRPRSQNPSKPYTASFTWRRSTGIWQ